MYSLYCVYPLSVREESRTIYPLNTGEKLAERARIGIEPVGPYAYGTHEHKMRGPGARVSHAGPCPSHTGPRPATPIQLSVRWDRHWELSFWIETIQSEVFVPSYRKGSQKKETGRYKGVNTVGKSHQKELPKRATKESHQKELLERAIHRELYMTYHRLRRRNAKQSWKRGRE